MLKENHGVLITFDQSYSLIFRFDKFIINMVPFVCTLSCSSDLLSGIPVDELYQIHCDIVFYKEGIFHQLDHCVIESAKNIDWQPCENNEINISLMSISEYDIYPAHYFTTKLFNELSDDIKITIEKVKLGTT